METHAERKQIWRLPNGQTTYSYDEYHNAYHEIIHQLERLGFKIHGWGNGFSVSEEGNPNSCDLPLWVVERFLVGKS